MTRFSLIAAFLLLGAAPFPALAQIADMRPVTDGMLLDPDPADWLMINRTFDEQRFSPLDQVTSGNVGRLGMAWVRGLPQGSQETVPIVHDGIMYVVAPGAGVIAIDATNGDEIWEYYRDMPRAVIEFTGPPEAARTKNLGIYEDMIYYPAPDGFLVALDARSGEVRWETEVYDYTTRTQHTGGVLIADGKVITNRTCEQRTGCFISAHDARTGAELWKFYTTPAPGAPGGDTWGDVPLDARIASSWGLPGSYDPVRRLTFWAVANPKPYTRLKRHGAADGTARIAPADLYSNSTVALDIETGELAWYYQHLPGDDWDADHIHERTLVRTPVTPDPSEAKWINPAIASGEERDAVVAVGEGGGMWLLDRDTGEFLWARPFPYDVPEFNISGIDLETGQTQINWDNVFKNDGDKVTTCYHNTRGYWSTAYDPTRNALYIPFHDACLVMEAVTANPLGFGQRTGIQRPGTDPEKFTSIGKVDLATGKMEVIYSQRASGNGSALVTGGDLLFWGDMNRRFRAFDPDSGEILWETVLGGIIQTSTITYAVNGRQYIAVMTGDGQSATNNPVAMSGVSTVRGHNAIYAFALPEGE